MRARSKQLSRDEILTQAEKFFLLAMSRGYASGTKERDYCRIPGHEEIRFRDVERFPDFLLVNRWCTGPNSRVSAGNTTIFYQLKPIWVMYYGGRYEKSETDFLKQALLAAYNQNLFVGGRGPAHFAKGEKLYQNFLSYPQTEARWVFEEFEGYEFIRNSTTAKLLGQHWYRGMSLI